MATFRRTPALIRRGSWVMAFVGVALGCSSDLTFAPPGDFTGSYSMRSVDGATLPTAISSNGTAFVEIIGGTVDLDSDSTWLGRTNFRITTAGGVQHDTQADSGRWSLIGDSLRFNPAGTTMGRIHMDTLWLIRRTAGEETTYIYTR
jgi:hypothetical protein